MPQKGIQRGIHLVDDDTGTPIGWMSLEKLKQDILDDVSSDGGGGSSSGGSSQPKVIGEQLIF